jgi:hypothetical protein
MYHREFHEQSRKCHRRYTSADTGTADFCGWSRIAPARTLHPILAYGERARTAVNFLAAKLGKAYLSMRFRTDPDDISTPARPKVLAVRYVIMHPP